MTPVNEPSEFPDNTSAKTVYNIEAIGIDSLNITAICCWYAIGPLIDKGEVPALHWHWEVGWYSAPLVARARFLLKIENCHYAKCVVTVIMTTSGGVSDDEVGIMTNPHGTHTPKLTRREVEGVLGCIWSYNVLCICFVFCMPLYIPRDIDSRLVRLERSHQCIQDLISLNCIYIYTYIYIYIYIRPLVRLREVSKPRDNGLESFNRCGIWQASRQHCCWSACQFSEQ